MVPEVWRLRQKDHDCKAKPGDTVSICPERHREGGADNTILQKGIKQHKAGIMSFQR